MDDTISRAAVLEIIREHCPDEPKSKDLREYWKKRFAPLIKVRKEIEKIPLADRWSPCGERLPKDEEVIVSVRDDSGDNTLDYSSFGWYACAGDFWVVDNEPNYKVVAWKPLPAAYQKGG